MASPRQPARTEPDAPSASRVDAVRRFNRFYTRRIGVLARGLLSSPFSLAQARVLYELAHREQPTAAELRRELGLDAGYLSRILRGLERRRLVQARPWAADRRRRILALTAKGREAVAVLDERSRQQMADMLRPLSELEQRRLLEAMGTIECLLGPNSGADRGRPYLLRSHQPGDMGWVVHRHGALYAQEYGWDEQFEALVARVVADFVRHFDPTRERCWIAERDGEILGSVFLVKRSKTVAQLRLLLVEPAARGLGIGSRLVEECVRFARLAGYRKVMLWTNDVLHAARRIYERSGFRLVGRERHHSFGRDLVGETWELEL